MPRFFPIGMKDPLQIVVTREFKKCVFFRFFKKIYILWGQFQKGNVKSPPVSLSPVIRHEVKAKWPT